jgi:hypothetical protein
MEKAPRQDFQDLISTVIEVEVKLDENLLRDCDECWDEVCSARDQLRAALKPFKEPRTPPEPFRQDTPVMQLASVTQALWGQASNFRNGVTGAERAATEMAKQIDFLSKLLPYVRKGTW